MSNRYLRISVISSSDTTFKLLNWIYVDVNDVSINNLGSARRKKKVVHRTAASDDKKLQASLKKLMMNNIPGV